jgi:hypothetical protein
MVSFCVRTRNIYGFKKTCNKRKDVATSIEPSMEEKAMVVTEVVRHKLEQCTGSPRAGDRALAQSDAQLFQVVRHHNNRHTLVDAC